LNEDPDFGEGLGEGWRGTMTFSGDARPNRGGWKPVIGGGRYDEGGAGRVAVGVVSNRCVGVSKRDDDAAAGLFWVGVDKVTDLAALLRAKIG
jgi:hypothetical protein